MTRRRIGGKEPYARIYASAKDHPRHLAAGLAAEGLWKRAMAYCADHLTDGLVPESWLRAQGGPKPLKAAVDAGLFVKAPGGYMIRDYLDHNTSREDVEERRGKERGKKAGIPRGNTPGNPQGNGRGIPRDSDTQILKDPPKPPQGGSVVKFNRKPVPPARLALAVTILNDFNAQAGTTFTAYRGDGSPSDSLTRIIGALTHFPDRLDADTAHRLTATALKSRWWGNSPAAVGVVFGPGVIEQNLARLAATGVQREGSNLDAIERALTGSRQQ